jgi:hypothetical protein
LINKNFTLKNYKFRFGKLSETNLIINFIKKNWKTDHILGKNKSYFLYQFKNKNKINFILAINKITKEIDSIHGFLKYSDKKYNSIICGSIAAVRIGNNIPFLGLETFKQLLNKTKPSLYIGIGVDQNTMLPLLKKFYKFHSGTMDHYYKINPSIKKFHIAKINKIRKSNYHINKDLLLTEIHSFLDLKNMYKFTRYKFLPQKNLKYLNKRYFNHPKYNYRFFILNKNIKKNRSLLIGREIKKENHKIFRFVDFIGNIKDLAYMGKATNKMLIEEKFEYLDFLTCNMHNKYLKKSGFILKDQNDKNIIPNYFEPFLKKNIKTFFVSSKKGIILFKADADQDSPRE